MECFKTFSEGLRKKNVEAVITCSKIDSEFEGIRETKDYIYNVISETNLINPHIIEDIVFVGNEPIGTKYILYRYRVILKNIDEYISVRVIVKTNIIYLLVFVVGKNIPLKSDAIREHFEPAVFMEKAIRKHGSVSGQKYIPNFIIYRILGQPIVDIDKWKLTIEGFVKRKLEYSYNKLLSMSNAKLIADFHCVTGWSVKGVVWEGIVLKNLVGEDNILPEAKWVYTISLDGYSTIIPINDFLSEKSLLVLKINGKVLSLEQGFPARIFIPHLYGWKGAKWVTRIVFTDKYMDGFWEALGHHPRGNVFLEERFK